MLIQVQNLVNQQKIDFFWQGPIHVLRNQNLGFLTPVPFVITFSTERNQKLPFSDPPPFCDYVIHGYGP